MKNYHIYLASKIVDAARIFKFYLSTFYDLIEFYAVGDSRECDYVCECESSI